MIHQYKNNGYNIVLDVYSGAVHVVDDLCYDVIAVLNEPDEEPTAEILKSDLTWENLKKRLGDTYSEKDLRDALDDVIELTEDGKLFTKDEFEYLVPIVKKRKTVVNSGSRRNLEVDFFGGEPLMNWQVVKDLVAYGREQEKLHDKNFRFTVTTNGVLLNDEIQEFVNKEMDNVVLSLDGRKEINDKMRPFRNGKGSYDLIVPKFQKLAESRNQEKYYIRGTFTRNNLDFSNDILHFADLGFKQMSIEPVVGDESDPYAIREEDIPQIKEEYDKLAKIMIEREKEGKGFNFFHFMIDLEGGPCVMKRMSGCGSGTEYLSVTPWGDLYPCHQFVGQEEFLMGNVDDGIVKPEIADDFRSCSVYSKEKCKNCFAKFYCSGGCMANSYNFHGTIHDCYDVGCEMQRKRVECAIMIKAALADA